MDYDSAADMVAEEVVTGSELYDLFKNQVQVQENDAVIQQACLLLSEAGITQAWQLEEVPMEVLRELMPPGQHLKPYLVTAHVQRTLKQGHAPKDASDKVAEALMAYTAENKKARQQRKRGRESSESDEEVELKDYDCAASLKVYSLDIPSENLPRLETMKSEAKLAATGFKRRKGHLVQSALDKYPPTLG